jgi:hypothetical protein
MGSGSRSVGDPPFPEGIELYTWYRTDRGYWLPVAVPLQEEQRATGSYYDYLPVPGAQVVVVERMRGPWGWDEEWRIGVAFYGAPLPNFDEIMDAPKGFDMEQVRGHERAGRILLSIERIRATWERKAMDDPDWAGEDL